MKIIIDKQSENADALAQQLQLTVADSSDSEADYALTYLNTRLSLIALKEKFAPLCIDFTNGQSKHRRFYGGGKNQTLARAVGLNKKNDLKLIDASAGLGRDAFVLATLGCQVTLLERNPILHALLTDALVRAKDDDETAVICSRMTLHLAEASTFLSHNHCDVVYFDPMYPKRSKNALVKKEMRIISTLVGQDEDAFDTLQKALTCANYRVVVKRPSIAAALSPASFSVKSPNTRYDIYAR